MNILVLTDQFYPASGGTANVLDIITTYLNQNGCSVVVALIQSGEKKKSILIHAQTKIFQILIQNNDEKMNDESDSKIFVLIGSLRRLIEKVFNRIILSINASYTKQNREIFKQIRNIASDEHIDVVISVANPFNLNYLGWMFKKVYQIEWFIYMLDPYFDHYLSRHPKFRLLKEASLIKKSDGVIVTDLIYESYKNKLKTKYMPKVKKINYPNIRNLQYKPVSNNIYFDRDDINCVFTGYLYSDIRSPEFVFDLLMETKNPRIKLFIIGGLLGLFEENFINKYRKMLGDKLVFIDRVDSNVAFNAILNADILINIGNTIPNQATSKIFDYISSGKPIVNFYKIMNCPSLVYTRKYPLCLNIFEGQGLNNETVNHFETFCVENKTKKIDYSIIKELYTDCTAEVVGKDFLTAITSTEEKDEING